MRLLFVHERFGAMAGAEANIFVTATELKRRGHEVGIIHGSRTGKNEPGWEKLFSPRYDLNGSDRARTVAAALKDFCPDIVYVHKMADLGVIEALANSGLPLVRMVHDHEMYCMRSYKYFYFSRKICTRPAGLHCVFPCGAFIARNHGGTLPIKYVSYLEKRREIELNKKFHRMIVVTRYMREELLRNGFDERRIEIHAPVPRMADSGVRANYGERNLIVYAGQVIRGKGVDMLLRSLALLKVPFECIILGEGSHKSYCEKLSRRLGLDDRVRFAGFVPQEELTTFYRDCTVVAISSVWPEPFATIGMEAMRHGIPVVAFDVGGIRDWLFDGFNGYLVRAMDFHAYAARLEKLLTDKALARDMGERGLKLVTYQFDFGCYIENLETMFLRVLGQHRDARNSVENQRSVEPFGTLSTAG